MFENYQNKVVVMAVSGGPDSMAALHMAWKQNIKVIVCHVNYHKRVSSKQDEEIVHAFCKNHHIPYHIRHASTAVRGNFQDYARVFRYEFFQEIYQQYHAEGLFTAHHLDDFLETALMRKEQGRKSDYYGIQEETIIYRMRVIRPLLSWFKEDLIQYCIDNQIPFGIDESNNSITYERNRIRHTILSQYDKEKKWELKKQIDSWNQETNLEQKACDAILNKLECKERIDVLLIREFPYPLQLIRRWLQYFDERAHFVSEKQVHQILSLIKTNKGQKKVLLFDDFEVVREYNELVFRKIKPYCDYSYQLNCIEEMVTPWFKIQCFGDSKDGIMVREEDFPLIIRNARSGDSIRMPFGHKKLSRYFIDQKIPKELRQSWPVVVNSRNEIIFVCTLGANCEYFSNTPNLFVVK